MPVELLKHIFSEQLSAIRPAAALREVVTGYYPYTSGQSERPVWATLDGHPALIFLLDAPYNIRFTGTHTLCLQHAFFCCYGLQNTYIQAWPKGMRMLVVQFTCNGLYQLLQQPLPSVAAARHCCRLRRYGVLLLSSWLLTSVRLMITVYKQFYWILFYRQSCRRIGKPVI